VEAEERGSERERENKFDDEEELLASKGEK